MRKRLRGAGFSAVAAALAAVGLAASAPAQPGPPHLLGLRISNGGTPFAGDTPWLATVSPNGDGFRDRALIRFKLDRPATVEIRAVATAEAERPAKTTWKARRQLAAGPHVIAWRPKRSTPSRTYLLRFVVAGSNCERRAAGQAPAVLVRHRAEADGPRPAHRRGPRRPRGADRLAAPRQRCPLRADRPGGRGQERALLPAGDDLRPARRLCAADPATAHPRRAPRGGRPLHEHVAGAQLRRRNRRRLGRQLERRRGHSHGRPATPVPRLRRARPFSGLEPELHLLAQPHREVGGLPLGRRPRARPQRRSPPPRVRPRRLPGPRGVCERARLRRRAP